MHANGRVLDKQTKDRRLDSHGAAMFANFYPRYLLDGSH